MLRIGFPSGEMFEEMFDERKSKEEIISENILSRIFSLIPISEP